MLELAAELGRLQAAAAANKLTQADTSGGTFTLSNIGTIGGTYATPLVNVPEARVVPLSAVRACFAAQELPALGQLPGRSVGERVSSPSRQVVLGATAGRIPVFLSPHLAPTSQPVPYTPPHPSTSNPLPLPCARWPSWLWGACGGCRASWATLQPWSPPL